MKPTNKDLEVLIGKPNSIIDGVEVARARLENVPNSILKWYEENEGLINAQVVIVRGKEDEGKAAFARNSSRNTLFVFGCNYFISRYFSGTTRLIELPKDLLKRA